MLRIYDVMLQLVRDVQPLIGLLERRDGDLARQCRRALASGPLNVAEGSYSRGGNRTARYHTAAGSMREALSCLEVGAALGFLAALDARERFRTSHGVQSYLGLTPGEHSSSESERRTGITKAGARQVRWVLVQAAWSALRYRPQDAMVRWARRVAERRGRSVAVVALARKMAGILFAIWRDGTTYQANRGADLEVSA